MHIVILNIFDVCCVAMMSETSETCSIQICCKRSVASNETIYSHIKLLSANKQGIYNVLLHDVGFSLWWFRFPSEIILPLCNLLQLIEQKDSFALRLCNWLHNPNCTRCLLLELLHEEWVISRQVVSSRVEVVPKYEIISFDFYPFASSYFPSFSRNFLCLLRFLTIKSFLVSS